MERKTELSQRHRHFQALIQSLATDSELARKRCLLFVGAGAAAQFDSLIVRQRLLVATICAALLGQRDPFSLSFADQRPLELSGRTSPISCVGLSSKQTTGSSRAKA